MYCTNSTLHCCSALQWIIYILSDTSRLSETPHHLFLYLTLAQQHWMKCMECREMDKIDEEHTQGTGRGNLCPICFST